MNYRPSSDSDFIHINPEDENEFVEINPSDYNLSVPVKEEESTTRTPSTGFTIMEDYVPMRTYTERRYSDTVQPTETYDQRVVLHSLKHHPRYVQPGDCRYIEHILYYMYMSELPYKVYKVWAKNAEARKETIYGMNWRVAGNTLHLHYISQKAAHVVCTDDVNKYLIITARGTSFTDWNVLQEFLVQDIIGIGLGINMLSRVFDLLNGFETMIKKNQRLIEEYLSSGYKLILCGHSLGGTVVNEFNKLLNYLYHSNITSDLQFLLPYMSRLAVYTFNRGAGISARIIQNITSNIVPSRYMNAINFVKFADRENQTDIIAEEDFIPYTKKNTHLVLIKTGLTTTMTTLLKPHSAAAAKNIIKDVIRKFHCEESFLTDIQY